MTFVAYLRVSTREQGQSGLGLEAQRNAIAAYVARQGGDLLNTFTEVESGKIATRPELTKALSLAKRKKATLIISKLDRLSRSVAFIAALMEAGVDFVALDMPTANKLTIHIMAAMAEHEREMIAKRTSDALQAKKRQGAKLGLASDKRADAASVSAKGTESIKIAADTFAAKMKPVIEGLRAEGKSTYKTIAAALNDRGFATPRGGEQWHVTTVRNVCVRAGIERDGRRKASSCVEEQAA